MSRRRKSTDGASRREFMKASAWVASGAVAGGLNGADAVSASTERAVGEREIRIGLIGCGRRGIKAAIQALNTASRPDLHPNGPVRLVALGDAFPNRLQAAYRAIKGQHPRAVDVPGTRRFTGLDAYRRVIDCDLDLVILATPPGWRPLHFEAVVRADKHVFMEKPCAVDGPGVRRLLASNELAKRRGLIVAVGLQRRHEAKYRETIARVHDGAIGRILFTRVYWNAGGPPRGQRRATDSELQHQLRNWRDFPWLSGGIVCERHVHNLDVGNWIMRSLPVECNAMGAGGNSGQDRRQAHAQHFCEFTYPNGAKMYSQCRQVRGAWNHVSEHAHGTHGTADISGGRIFASNGDEIWRSKANSDGYQLEQNALIQALRRGQPHNELEYGAASTLTAVMARQATETGCIVTWTEIVQSDSALAEIDRLRSLQQTPPVLPNPDGSYSVPLPGEPSLG